MEFACHMRRQLCLSKIKSIEKCMLWECRELLRGVFVEKRPDEKNEYYFHMSRKKEHVGIRAHKERQTRSCFMQLGNDKKPEQGCEGTEGDTK